MQNFSPILEIITVKLSCFNDINVETITFAWVLFICQTWKDITLFFRLYSSKMLQLAFMITITTKDYDKSLIIQSYLWPDL